MGSGKGIGAIEIQMGTGEVAIGGFGGAVGEAGTDTVLMRTEGVSHFLQQQDLRTGDQAAPPFQVTLARRQRRAQAPPLSPIPNHVW